MQKSKLECCVKLTRIMPLHKLEKNLNAISSIIYEDDNLLNNFLQKVDSPLEICKDDVLGDYIKSEYNRDGDSYRSPHSNIYFPLNEDGKLPINELRELEINLNRIFQFYTKAYYSSLAVSSVYLWEFGESIQDGFAAVILIKNSVNHEKKIDSGVYESTNLITVTFVNKKSHFGQEYVEVIYKLTTSVILSMFISQERLGDINVSGSLTKQFEETKEISGSDLLDNNFHISNIGPMVEIMENNIRNVLEEVYLKKSREIIDTARSNSSGTMNAVGNAVKQIFHGK